jgi:hypothetical protein
MKTILIGLCLAVHLNCIAQCGLKTQYDEFEKTTTTTTGEFTIMNTPLSFIVGKSSWKVELFFFKVNTTYNVLLSHQGNSTSSIKYIYFKFTDGELIKKIEPQEYKRSDDAFGSGESRATSFTLTKKELEKFTTTEVEKLRFEFDYFPNQQLVDKEMNKTQKKNFLKYATCLFNAP